MEMEKIMSKGQQERIIQQKERMIRRLFEDTTSKVIRQFQRGIEDQPSIARLHCRFYEQFRREIENNCSAFFIHQENYAGMSMINVFDSLVQSLEAANDFVQTQISQQQHQYLLNKNASQTTFKRQVCERCSHLILSQKVEAEKNKIMFGQFADPFHLYGLGKGDFFYEAEPQQTNQQPEIPSNERIVNKHLTSVEEGLKKRTNQILIILSEFQKYEVRCDDTKQNRRKEGHPMSQTCLNEMISILHDKFMPLFARLKKKISPNSVAEVGVQAGEADKKRQKMFQDQIHQFHIELELKKKEHAEMTKALEDLQYKLHNYSHEKEQIKLKYMESLEQGAMRSMELEKQQAIHKITTKRLSDVERICREIKVELKQAKQELAKHEQQHFIRKRKEKKSTKIYSRKRLSQSHRDVNDHKTVEEANHQNEKSVSSQLSEKDTYLRLTHKSVKKMKVTRSPTIQSFMTGNKSIQSRKDVQISFSELNETSLKQVETSINLIQSLAPQINVRSPDNYDEVLEESNREAYMPGQTNKAGKRFIKQKSSPNRGFKLQTPQAVLTRSTSEINLPKFTQNKFERVPINVSHPGEGMSLEVPNNQLLKRGKLQRVVRASAPICNEPKVMSDLKKIIMSQSKANSIFYQNELDAHQSVRNTSKNTSEFVPFNLAHNPNNPVLKKGRRPKQSIVKERKLNQTHNQYAINSISPSSEREHQKLNLTTSFYGLQQSSIYRQSDPKYGVNEIFTKEDVSNLYLSLEGALDHEKWENKPNRHAANISTNSIIFSNKVLALIASLNAKNRYLYEAVKGILTFPYQTIVSQQNYIFIAKSSFSSGKMREAISKIQTMHKHCEGENRTCSHLKIFQAKLESLLSWQDKEQ